MKKALAIMLLLSLTLTLASCSFIDEALATLGLDGIFGEKEAEKEVEEEEEEEEEEKKDPPTSGEEEIPKAPTTTEEEKEEEKKPVLNSAVAEWVASDTERAYYEIFEGKTINVIGDSLLAGGGIGQEFAWPSLLAAKYSMTYDNKAIGGCTLSACEGGENPIINRYQTMPDNDPDIVIFEGGRNDYNKDAALGTHTVLEPDTYKGALAMLIKGLREKYPNAVIIGVSFWESNSRVNSGGKTCSLYTDAMLDVCARLGVTCIDATVEESGIRMNDADFREQYCKVPSDVCHLNFEGMKLALEFFEREIARIYAEER